MKTRNLKFREICRVSAVVIMFLALSSEPMMAIDGNSMVGCDYPVGNQKSSKSKKKTTKRSTKKKSGRNKGSRKATKKPVRFEYGKLTYEITSKTNKTVAVVDRQMGYYDVVVPDTVPYNGVNYTVTEIGDYAFFVDSFGIGLDAEVAEKLYEDMSNVKSIYLPNTIKRIGESAISGLYIDAITLPDSIEVIDDKAFCNNIFKFTEIILPETLKVLGDWAFFEGEFTTITIPASVIKIGHNPFAYCTELESINVETENSNYVSVDGVLFTKDMKRLVAYPASKKCEVYNVPNGVKVIGTSAFYCGCPQHIILPEGIEIIENEAFHNSSPSKINLPKSLKVIDNWLRINE